jgi:hypothetical protein
MKEYKISRGWAIFIYITLPLFIALFGWLFIMPFATGSENDLKTFWFLGPMSIGMIVLLVVGLRETIKGRFVIDNNRIFSVGAFSNKELMFDEIKGYRITEKYILIESNNENKKKIKVSTYFGNTDEIVQWLSDNYPDLDVVNVKQEKEEILSNEEFGYTTEEREIKLQKAFKTAKVLNWTGGIIGVWVLFFPKPYEYAIIASAVLPVICLVVVKYFNGLIRINEKKRHCLSFCFLGNGCGWYGSLFKGFTGLQYS